MENRSQAAERMGRRDFPFYVCQLAGQDAGSNNPIIRESQAAILSLPNNGMAVTIDIGEQKNVHPKDKQMWAIGSAGSLWPMCMASKSNTVDQLTNPCPLKAIRSAFISLI